MNELVSHFRAKNPQSQLTDSEITLRYANRYGAEALKERYPGWWNDYKSYLDEVDPVTMGDRVGAAVTGVKKGVMGGLAEIPEFAGIVSNQIANNFREEPKAPDNIFTDMGEAIRGTVEDDTDIRLRDSMAFSKVPQGIGSAGAFIAASVATGGAGTMARAGLAAAGKGAAADAIRSLAKREISKGVIRGELGDLAKTATIGAMMSAPSGFRDAMANDAGIDKAYESFWWNALGGLTEAAGIGAALGRFTTKLDKASGGKLRDQLIKDVLPETIEEAAQEMIQGQWADAVARNIVKYDPERKFLWENLAEDGAVGGITGSIVSMVVSSLNRRADFIEKTEGPKLRQDLADEVEKTAGGAPNTAPTTTAAPIGGDGRGQADQTAGEAETETDPFAEDIQVKPINDAARKLVKDPGETKAEATTEPETFEDLTEAKTFDGIANDIAKNPGLQETAFNIYEEEPDPLLLPESRADMFLEVDGKKMSIYDITAVEFPVDKVEVDNTMVPQFKADADPTTGETKEGYIKAEEYTRPANNIVIWELNNGRHIVVTGRHRLALAKRLGEKTIPATIVKESDGFTKEMAATFDAEINIRDEKGTVLDFAQYFENAPIDEAEAHRRGLLTYAKGRAGWSLARYASEDLKALFKAGRISEAKTVVIANAAPNDDGVQRVGIDSALNGEAIEEIVTGMEVAIADKDDFFAEQGELFGDDDSAMLAAREAKKRAIAIKRSVREKIQAIKGAAKNPKVAAKFNIDVNDPEGLRRSLIELEDELERWKKWYLYDDLKAQVRGKSQPSGQANAPQGDMFSDEVPPGEQTEQAAEEQEEPRKEDTQTVDMFGPGGLFDAGAAQAEEPVDRTGGATGRVLEHRRQTGKLNDDHVMLFSDSERNLGYGDHVWTLTVDLPPVPDSVVEYAAEYFGVSMEEARALVNPENIVDSAAAWDDPQFVSEVYHFLGEPVGFSTPDGAVVLDKEGVGLEYRNEAEETTTKADPAPVATQPEAAPATDQDAEYMAAVEAGDMEKAEAIVDAVAKEKLPGSVKVSRWIKKGQGILEPDPYNDNETAPIFEDTNDKYDDDGGSDETLSQVFIQSRNPLVIGDSSGKVTYGEFKEVAEKIRAGIGGEQSRDEIIDQISRFHISIYNSDGLTFAAPGSTAPRDPDNLQDDEAAETWLLQRNHVLIDLAKRAGFDTIVINRKAEIGINSSLIPLDADRVFRADAVVRDDAGNIIPPSRRFETGQQTEAAPKPDNKPKVGDTIVPEPKGEQTKPAMPIKLVDESSKEQGVINLYVAEAKNYYTLWMTGWLRNDSGKPEVYDEYLTILPRDKEGAIKRAQEIAMQLATGERVGIGFKGKAQFQTIFSQAKELHVVNGIKAASLEDLGPKSQGEKKGLTGTDTLDTGKKHPTKTLDWILENDMGYAEWMVENAYSGRLKDAADYFRNHPAFVSRKDAALIEAQESTPAEVVESLKDEGVMVEIDERSGMILLTGKTYEIKDSLKEYGARWTGSAWAIKPDKFREWSGQFRDILIGQDSGGELSDAGLESAKLRRERAADPDRSGLAKPIGEYVGEDTQALLKRGEAVGMPPHVVTEQIEDVAFIRRGYEEGNPLFLLASQPGSGKTFVLGAAIQELKRAGAKDIVYVTLRKELIDQIKNDLADYDIQGVRFMTYTEIRTAKATTSDVLIFDEAHAVKNVAAETQQAKKAADWIKQSKYPIFSTATPFEDPTQAEYLDPTGVFNDAFGGFDGFAGAFGGRRKKFRLPNGNTVEKWTYRRGQNSDADLMEAREFFRKRGLFSSRKTTLQEGAKDARMVKVSVDPEYVTLYEGLLEAIDNGYDKLGANARMWFVNFQKRILEASKIREGIKIAEDALTRGRFPIIFVETKAEKIINIPDLLEAEEAWQTAVNAAQLSRSRKPARSEYGLPPEGVTQILDEFMSATGMEEITIDPAEDIIKGHFGAKKVAVFTGSVTPKKAQENLDAWRAGDKPVLVATMAKGGTGLSLHDKKGDHQTTQINVNLPWTATQVTQVAQRSARYGLQGTAEMVWLFTDDINFDKKLASKVGGRMASMGALVSGEKPEEADSLEDWNFHGEPFKNQMGAPKEKNTQARRVQDQAAETGGESQPTQTSSPSPSEQDTIEAALEIAPPPAKARLPWIGATTEQEFNWTGTRVFVAPKGKRDESFRGTVQRVLNNGDLVEVERDGFPGASVRVTSDRLTILENEAQPGKAIQPDFLTPGSLDESWRDNVNGIKSEATKVLEAEIQEARGTLGKLAEKLIALQESGKTTENPVKDQIAKLKLQIEKIKDTVDSRIAFLNKVRDGDVGFFESVPIGQWFGVRNLKKGKVDRDREAEDMSRPERQIPAYSFVESEEMLTVFPMAKELKRALQSGDMETAGNILFPAVTGLDGKPSNTTSRAVAIIRDPDGKILMVSGGKKNVSINKKVTYGPTLTFDANSKSLYNLPKGKHTPLSVIADTKLEILGSIQLQVPTPAFQYTFPDLQTFMDKFGDDLEVATLQSKDSGVARGTVSMDQQAGENAKLGDFVQAATQNFDYSVDAEAESTDAKYALAEDVKQAYYADAPISEVFTRPQHFRFLLDNSSMFRGAVTADALLNKDKAQAEQMILEGMKPFEEVAQLAFERSTDEEFADVLMFALRAPVEMSPEEAVRYAEKKFEDFKKGVQTKYRTIPGSVRESTAEIRRRFFRTVNMAVNRGVDLRIAEGQIEKALFIKDKGRRMVRLVINDVFSPTQENYISLIHEIGHQVFDDLNKSDRDLLIEAMSDVSYEALGIDGYEATINGALPEAARNLEEREEMLVEAAARIAAVRGMPRRKAISLVGKFVNRLKQVFFSTINAIHKMRTGRDNPALVARWLSMRIEGALTGNHVISFQNFSAGPIQTLFDRSSMYPQMGGKSIEDVAFDEAGYFSARKVIAMDHEAEMLNMEIDDAAGNPNLITKWRRVTSGRLSESNRKFLELLKNASVNAYLEANVFRPIFDAVQRGYREQLDYTKTMKEVLGAESRELPHIKIKRMVESSAFTSLSEDQQDMILAATQDPDSINRLEPNIYGPEAKKQVLGITRTILHRGLKAQTRFAQYASEANRELSELETLLKDFSGQRVTEKATVMRAALQTAQKYLTEHRALREENMRGIRDDVPLKSLRNYYKIITGKRLPKGFNDSVKALRESAKTDELIEAFNGLADVLIDRGESFREVNLMDLYTDILQRATKDKRLALFKDDIVTTMLFASFRKRPEIAAAINLRRLNGVDFNLINKLTKLVLSRDPDNIDQAAEILAQFPPSALRHVEELETSLKAAREKRDNILRDLQTREAATRILANSDVVESINRRMERDLKAQLWLKQGGALDPDELKELSNTLGGEANWELTDHSPLPSGIRPNTPPSKVFSSAPIVRWKDIKDTPVAYRRIENQMTQWLDKNAEEGGSVYDLVYKMREEIRNYRSHEIRRHVKRSSHLFMAGSIRDKLKNIDHPIARQLVTAISQYQSKIETASGKRTVDSIAIPWSNAAYEVSNALGITVSEAIDYVARPALHYIADATDISVENALMESLTIVARHVPIKDPNVNAVDLVNKNREAILNWIRAYGDAAGKFDRMRESMGVKIEDELRIMVDGKVQKSRFGRDSIGHRYQRVPRFASSRIRHTVAAVMMDELAMDPRKASEALAGLDMEGAMMRGWDDPRVVEYFIRPFLENEVSNPLVNGRRDISLSNRIYTAFENSESLQEAIETIADFDDFVRVELDEEGNEVETRMDPMEIMALLQNTFVKVHATLSQDNDPTRVQSKDEIRHVSMDARVTEGWPMEWIEIARFDSQSVQQNASVLALHATFGRDMVKWMKQVQNLTQEMRTTSGDFERRRREIGDEALKEQFKKRHGKNWRKRWEYLNDTKKFVTDMVSVSEDMDRFVTDTLGTPLEQQYLQEVIGLFAAATVQGPGSLITESGSVTLMPLIRMGLMGGTNFIKHIGSNAFKRTVNNIMAATGRQLVYDMEMQKMWAESGRGDASSQFGLKERLRAIDLDRKVLDRNEGISKSALRLIRKSKALLFDAGIQNRNNPDQKTSDTIKLQSPMTMFNEVMKFSVAQSFYTRFGQMVEFLAKEMDGMTPKEMDDFQITTDLFDGKNQPLSKMFKSEKEKDFFLGAIQDYGIDLKSMAKNYMLALKTDPKAAPVTNKDMILIGTMIDSEFFLDGNMITRSPFFMTTNVGKVMAPLFAWAWSMTNILSRQVWPESWSMDDVRQAFKIGMLPIIMATPAAVALSYLRDMYDEEALGKRSNIPDVLNTDNPLAAYVERVARTGMLGMAGDVADQIANPDPGVRLLSLGTDIYVINMLNAPVQFMKEFKQADGNVTYSSMGRRMLQTFGLNGYLQNFQIMNRMLGLDNEEARFNRRVHTGNVIQLAAKATGVPIRAFSGGVTSPTPWKPYVKSMVQAAMAGDYATFRISYEKAKAAARKAGKEDPEQTINLSFQSNHPLKLYFKQSITNHEFQKMLRAMSDSQRDDVLGAISNINRFGKMIGIQPYTGKEPSTKRRQMPSLVTDFGI